jgi:hypothetical protein
MPSFLASTIERRASSLVDDLLADPARMRQGRTAGPDAAAAGFANEGALRGGEFRGFSSGTQWPHAG